MHSQQPKDFHSIQALALFAGRQSIPDGPAWLNAALLKKVRALPLQRFKRFTIAGVKALGAYGKTDETKWHKAMVEASEKYTQMRLTGKRTKREAEYASIRKLAKTLHSEVAHLEELKPKDLTHWLRWLFQRYVIILFYSHHALRGDLADVQLRKGASSWIRRKGSKWTIHIGDHKTVKSRGAIEFVVDDAVSAVFNKFVPMVRAASSNTRIY